MIQNRYAWLLPAIVVVSVAGCRTAPAAKGPVIMPEQKTGAALPADPLHPVVKIETSLGEITLALDAKNVPDAVLHFVQYIDKKFYDGTLFHRIPEAPEIIQGGGYAADMTAKNARYSTAFPGHWSTHHVNRRGAVAMLRGQGPAGTGTAEFFINTADNHFLDGTNDGNRYAVVGHVTQGLHVVDAIRSTPVGTHPAYAAGQSRVVPVRPIVIKSVRLLTAFDREKVSALAQAMHAAPEDPVGTLVKELERNSGNKAVETASGLICVDFRLGQGPRPIFSDMIKFHYRGTFLDGSLFETTRDREPYVRPVSRLVVGLQEAVMSMNEGGRRTIICPSGLAFGNDGLPGKIPPGATLVFDLSLLSIEGSAVPDEK